MERGPGPASPADNHYGGGDAIPILMADRVQKILCIFIILVFCSAAACAGIHPSGTTAADTGFREPVQVSTTPGFSQDSGLILWNRTEIDRIRTGGIAQEPAGMKGMVGNITRSADRLLRETPPSVTEKTVLYGNAGAHDYISLSTYYWPDPKKPGGLPYIACDGVVNPERGNTTRFDEVRKGRMVDAVETLALAWALTGNETYAEKAGQYLRVWFLDPSTRMDPSLTYAQVVPGAGSTGRSSGIIDTIDFIRLTDAIRLLDGSRALAPDESAGLRDWFRNYAAWLRTSKNGLQESNATNNHGSWYDAQLAAYELFAGNPAGARAIVNASRERRIAAQVQPDGSLPRELARTRSFHYSLFDLEAFITLAREGEITGVDVWDYRAGSGGSIRAALDFVLPSLAGTREWNYTEIRPGSDPGFAPYLVMAGNGYRNQTYRDAGRALTEGASGMDAFRTGILDSSP